MSRIALVVSDVDGTLVTPDKVLTEASCRAVHRLHERGIGFTVVSSRPPMGIRMLVEPLWMEKPIGTFNGGTIVRPDLHIIEQHPVPPAAARRAVDVMREFAVDIWVYTADAWLVRDPAGAYVKREIRTLQAQPTVVAEFAPYLSHCCKLVGSSEDYDRLARCEAAVRAAVGAEASASRSQLYYLDVTPPGVSKGTFVDAMSARLGIATEEIATIGDMDNDLAMFRRSGLSIAMGNATDGVKQAATCVTDTNTDEGFAKAIERYILANS